MLLSQLVTMEKQVNNQNGFLALEYRFWEKKQVFP